MTVTKFKTTKDWPFVIEFERSNEATGRTECLTLRTGNQPRSALIANAHKCATLALKFSGLHAITQASEGALLARQSSKLTGEDVTPVELSIYADLRFAFSSITWSEGDEPGAKVEVIVQSNRQAKNSLTSATTKLLLEKIEDREEGEWIGEKPDRQWQPIPGSLKNAFNESVRLLRQQVEAFAEGEFEQGDLFGSRTETRQPEAVAQ
jgi:hypothetical protein